MAGRRIVVTGAAGSVGRRVVQRLSERDDVEAVVALDIRPVTVVSPKVEAHIADVTLRVIDDFTRGADVLVHLATAFDPRRDGRDATDEDIALSERVLSAARREHVPRLVVLSSAMTYGAWADNPVPLTEEAPRRPNPEFAFAVAKAALEDLAEKHALEHPGTTVTVLRPTTALAEDATSWVARTLRSLTGVDTGAEEPPSQYLHLDDLAAAVELAATGDLDGSFNVAPDGSVDGETVRELRGVAPRVRVPTDLLARLMAFGWRHRLGPTPPGILPYLAHPWVVANDRLRSAGWEPEYTNEQAFVAGTPPRPWAMVTPKRRQQLSLGALAVAVAAAVAGGIFAWRRLRR
ncbi:MAG: NAD-dependent epimerase/dehydratase family protein [Acidimicrobiales bacterium]|nr:NAD-dependent epimerase/dehydratase family protein [Acidimicrobiales bacterium]